MRAVAWATGKSFTYEELCESFSDAKNLDYFLKYLKLEYYQDFFDRYLKPETIENYKKLKECNTFLERKLSDIEFKERLLSKKIDTLGLFNNREEIIDRIIQCEEWMKKSDVRYILSKVSEGKYICGSYYSARKDTDAMEHCLYSLIKSVEFKKGDFEYISRYGWFNFNNTYRMIVRARNHSAIKDFESYFDFTPFILNKHRLYLNIVIRVIVGDSWDWLRCTCFDPKQDKIRFVTANYGQEKQKRYCFTHKEFEEFFKDKKIDF
jgi:hypothetical protein